MVKDKTGLMVDPYFSASGVSWILEHVPGAREQANQGLLLMGTMDTWLIWHLTNRRVHATDVTNASRTLLFNIHTLEWDDDLLALFNIPRSLMPEVRPCDVNYGETDLNELLEIPIPIAGVLGDSHGALVGQPLCGASHGASYGLARIFQSWLIWCLNHLCPTAGLVTSVGFAALGEVYLRLEATFIVRATPAVVDTRPGSIWLIPRKARCSPRLSLTTMGFISFRLLAGLGAPCGNNEARDYLCGMDRGTNKRTRHIGQRRLRGH
jgi:glycerol kinase